MKHIGLILLGIIGFLALTAGVLLTPGMLQPPEPFMPPGAECPATGPAPIRGDLQAVMQSLPPESQQELHELIHRLPPIERRRVVEELSNCSAQECPQRVHDLTAQLGQHQGIHFFPWFLLLMLGGSLMLVLLVYLALHRHPVNLRPARCPHCSRPVESDWNYCPYCTLPLNPPASAGTEETTTAPRGEETR